MPTRKKIVIYTAISGGYDHLKPIPQNLQGYKFVCFTDKPTTTLTDQGWELRPIANSDLDNTRKVRKIKILAHEIFPEYEYSVWVDGSIALTNEAHTTIEKVATDNLELAAFSHPTRNCIYQEATECIIQHRDKPDTIHSWINHLKNEGYPKNHGLIESGVLIRKHNSPLMQEVSKEWWHYIKTRSKRDQLSFNFVAWRKNFSYALLPGSLRDGKHGFYFQDHKSHPIKNVYLWFDARRNTSIVCKVMATTLKPIIETLARVRRRLIQKLARNMRP